MGKLTVVGIGPGDYENMTVRADRVLGECQVIVGYHVYVDLVRERYPDKEFLTTPMTKEADRCRMALEEARKGKDVAMVCSGDSGVYGMAGLVYQLRGEAAEPEVEVIPGLTAACSGAALLGAPLTHDFAVVSLSDRLTAWETIEARLEEFRAQGWAERTAEGRWRLTPRGFLVSNQLIGDLLERQERVRLAELLPKVQARYQERRQI